MTNRYCDADGESWLVPPEHAVRWLELESAARAVLNFGEHEGECDNISYGGVRTGHCRQHLMAMGARERRLTEALAALDIL
jgi:hypothetical protein